MGFGVIEQRPGQLDSWTAFHLDALASESPDHPCPIRNDQIRGADHCTQIDVAARKHRHLCIQRDDLTSTLRMQADGCGCDIPAGINGNIENVATTLIARTRCQCFHPRVRCTRESRSGRVSHHGSVAPDP